MPLLAKITAITGHGGVHRHARAGRKRLLVAVQRAGAGFLHHAREFMAENERGSHHTIANPGVLVGMEIAAADSRHLDAQKRLGVCGRSRARHPLDPQIRRAVQARGQHGGPLCPPAINLAFAHLACLIPAPRPSVSQRAEAAI